MLLDGGALVFQHVPCQLVSGSRRQFAPSVGLSFNARPSHATVSWHSRAAPAIEIAKRRLPCPSLACALAKIVVERRTDVAENPDFKAFQTRCAWRPRYREAIGKRMIDQLRVDALHQPDAHIPGHEILCIHLQFTKLTSDSDVTSWSGHSPACDWDRGGWGTRR